MHQWYVSANGKDTNAGTIDQPWSLEHAGRGAGGRIVAGDRVCVRGGVYRSKAGEGFKFALSGSAADPITFHQRPGETAVLDGSIAEFATVGNTSWEPHGSLSATHNVYRSTQPFFLHDGVFYGGFVSIGGEWYSLAPHRTLAQLLSDTHTWAGTGADRYLGPGIAQDVDPSSEHAGHLFVRLDNSSPDAQLGRPVARIVDPDPRKHALHIGSSRGFGLTITGSHLVFEDFADIHCFGGCVVTADPAQTDVTLRNCGGRPLYFGARCGSIDRVVFDSCKFHAHMPSDRWWVAYTDIKEIDPPAGRVRKLGLDLGLARNVEVVGCLIDEFFDGILASGTVNGRAPHDVEVRGTVFNHVWDDAWQMYGNLYHVDFHHNFCYGAGPSVDHTSTDKPNGAPGTVYIHHNVIDTTTRLLFFARAGHPAAGLKEPIPLSSHTGPSVCSWPRKLYYNTIVTGLTPGSTKVDVGWALFAALAPTSTAQHEVYNNIFNVIDDRPGGRDFYADSGREVYDGNVYWHYQARSPWRFLHASDGSDNRTEAIKTVEQLRESRAYADSKRYYPPGWENSGLSVDPQLDDAFVPHAISCRTGAVDLTAKGWPGTESYQARRGAL